MHVKGIYDAERELVWRTLASKTTLLLDRDHLAGWVEFVEEEDEEFVEELSDAGCVLRLAGLGQVLFPDHVEIALKEGIGLYHAVDLGLGTPSILVAAPSFLGLELLNGDWVVDCAGLLGSQLSLLKHGQNWG